MNHSRRKFIKQTGMSLSAAAMLSQFDGLSRLEAQTASDYKALVCIFLFGGNDGNNTVIPYTNYAAYNAVRGSNTGLNVSQAELLKISAPSQSADFGLHPSLVELQALYQQRKLAVMCNTGTLVQPLTRVQFLNNAPRPEHLFSHSDQQVQWQAAVSSTTQAASGWGARTVEATAGLNGTNTFPPLLSVNGDILFGVGKNSRTFVPGAPLFGFPTDVSRNQRYKSLRTILTYDRDSILINANSGLTSAAIDNNNTYSVAMTGNTVATAFPATSLGNQLKQIATTIKARVAIGLKRQVFFASLGGFDTHSTQYNYQATLLSQVSKAMKAFSDCMTELGTESAVTTFTLSDFGRTLKPASGGGTDHGWGNHHFVMGGAVKGGDFYGSYPTLQLNGESDAGDEGRWIPTTSVDQYGATLASWFGVADSAMSTVFPTIDNYLVRNVGFMM